MICSFFSIPIFMYIILCCIPHNCAVHGADLTYISLLVIFCIIVHVTNTILNLWNRDMMLNDR